ncbi:MAG: hypothetical protein IIA62_09145, partial [Nitrospinae bacterium]|nr:hypothetical protein [Nitrospinota bacterium]
MRIITFPLVMCMLLLSSICEGKELKPQPHKYTAKVSTIRLNSLLLDKGKKQDDVVEVKVASIIFDPPLEIKDARKALRHSIHEINTLVDYTKDPYDISDRMSKLKHGGGSSMVDAIYQSCAEKLQSSPYQGIAEPRKVVFIIGDAHDNASK